MNLDLTIGAHLEKRYLIKNILGKGGMGAVYLAEDTRLDGRPVAVKEMIIHSKEGAEYEKALKQFKIEATMLAKLDHPHLPKVIDYFEDSKKHYLVMEYIKGETLKELIEKEGPFSEKQVIQWTEEICSALIYLHEQTPAIVFRDLKPQNIILNENNKIKLIDFGIAKIFNSSEETDTFIHARGSIGYCPPEQCSTKGMTDVRADIYALGATIHYLLSNRNPSSLPFVFPPIRELVPQCSEAMEKSLIKALELDYENRYTTIKDFRDDLMKIIEKKEKISMEDWLSKWWLTLALTITFYCAGLIGIRSLLGTLKPFFLDLHKPISFIFIFIYLSIPIGGLIFYLRKK